MERVANVRVNSYRGLQDVEMKGLQDINVLIGPTNTGKSSMLEAIFLATGPDRITEGLRAILRSRGMDGMSSLEALFPRLQSDSHIDILLDIASDQREERLTLKLGPCEGIRDSLSKPYADVDRMLRAAWNYGEYGEQSIEQDIRIRERDLDVSEAVFSGGSTFAVMGPRAWILPGKLLDPSYFDTSYSNAFVSGFLPELIEALRTLHPELEDIRPVKLEDDRWRIYVRLAGTALPMHAMGDGFKAAFMLLEEARIHDLLLLDTPEAYQHHKGLAAIAGGLVTAASQWRNRIILATQSLELLDLLLDKSTEREVGLQIYRFGLADGKATIYPPLSLADAREARALVGADLRG